MELNLQRKNNYNTLYLRTKFVSIPTMCIDCSFSLLTYPCRLLFEWVADNPRTLSLIEAT